MTIEGFTFKNLKADEAKGIYIKPGTSNITINNCTFSNIKCPNPTKNNEQGANAIFIKGSSTTPIDNIKISGCKLKNIGAGHSEAISIDGNCTNITVENTLVTSEHLKGNIGICVCGNYKTCKVKTLDRPRNVIISNCIVSNCISPYGDTAYGIYVDGGNDVKIIGNTVNSCEGGIEVGAETTNSKLSGKETENITVENNVITGCAYGVNIGGYEKKLGRVYNVIFNGNRLINCGGKNSEMLTLTKCKLVKISNSIFESRNKAMIIYNEMSSKYTKNVIFENNIYSNGGSSENKYFSWHNKKCNFSKWKSKTKDTGSRFIK